MAQHFAVAGIAGGMVRGPVAFHPENIDLGIVGVDHGEVDAVAGAANLGVNLIAPLAQGLGQLCFQGRARIGLSQAAFEIGQGGGPASGKLEKLAQVAHPGGGGAGQVDLFRQQGGDHQDLFAGAGDGHVEAPLPPLLVEWSEIHGDAPLGVGSVCDGEEDDVAFIALDVFEILDEDGFLHLLREPALQLGSGGPLAIEELLNELLLGAGKGHHAEALSPSLRRGEPAHHFGDDAFGLASVGAAAALVVLAVCHVEVLDGHALPDRWEGEQSIAVVAMIRKGDETLVARTVVPAELLAGQARRQAFIENALEVALFLGHFPLVAALEEGRGGQLLGIADHHRRPPPGEGPEGVPGGDLRGFVEDDDVERFPAGLQVLGHRKGAHEQARLEPSQQPGDLFEQAAHRKMTLLFLELS